MPLPTLPSSLLFQVSLLLAQITHVAADAAVITDAEAYNRGDYGQWPTQAYHTLKIKTPRWFVHHFDRDHVSPETHLFMAPIIPGQSRTPMIFDASDLSLVYADPSWDGGNDAKIQWYQDKPYLTFFSGQDFTTHASGGGVMIDNSYKSAFNITTVGLPTGADNHEFQLTPDGGALVNNYHNIEMNTTSMGGPENGLVKTCAFQEVDIYTNELRFSWKALDHFKITESLGDKYYDDVGGWDWFHMNAISKTPKGDYLISVRHLKMIALISGKDGHVMWQIGGVNNSFKDLSEGRATNFGFQHNARFVDETMTELTLFDNQAMHPNSESPGCKERCSRGLRIRLDYVNMTAQVVSELWHPHSVQAWAEGGYHLLPNGHAMLAWGVVPSFTEHGPRGEVLMNIQSAAWSTIKDGGDHMYRVYKANWTGTPEWGPSIAVADSLVCVSWNGATEVKLWALYSGNKRTDVNVPATIVHKKGFETCITRPANAPFLRAEALDKDGKSLRETQVVEVPEGRLRPVGLGPRHHHHHHNHAHARGFTP
ncbi:ASST-domain-containing protein [Microdochium trichocladiopsis]|uniref:ASST-domain-containing protein n=1 Tax=Microdochium trichocladiopsis TaxID=1682393 RepID=A0A9P8YDR3_9PEZI|nr:ASST-domain-containing protein [Microdochium trichocladiopsis]KAH7039932.1 ASST-domain-containing protein [Microdochium trichocladiopsis]